MQCEIHTIRFFSFYLGVCKNGMRYFKQSAPFYSRAHSIDASYSFDLHSSQFFAMNTLFAAIINGRLSNYKSQKDDFDCNLPANLELIELDVQSICSAHILFLSSQHLKCSVEFVSLFKDITFHFNSIHLISYAIFTHLTCGQ